MHTNVLIQLNDEIIMIFYNQKRIYEQKKRNLCINEQKGLITTMVFLLFLFDENKIEISAFLN